MNYPLLPKHVAGFTAALISCFFSQVAHSAIVYVDATTSNTVATDGTPAGDGWQTTSTNDTGLWRNRAFGNGSTIFEAQGTTTPDDNTNVDHEALTTTLTGFTVGATYDLYVYFWDNGDGWEMDAGLSAGALTEFTVGGAGTTVASASTFEADPLFTEGARTLYQASLGVGTVDGSGNLNFFVDDGDSETTTNAGRRTWYDGVGYELVAIPEPSSLFLAFTSMAALLLVRCRR